MVSCWSFISLRWCKGIFAIDNWNHDKFEGKPPWRVSGLDFPKETNPLNQSASECAEESLFHVPYAKIKDDKTKYICHRTTSISRLFCSIFFRMAVQPRGWGKPQQVSAYSLKASSVVCYGLLNDTRVCLKIESTYENYTKLSCFPLNVPFGGIPVYPIVETQGECAVSATRVFSLPRCVSRCLFRHGSRALGPQWITEWIGWSMSLVMQWVAIHLAASWI